VTIDKTEKNELSDDATGLAERRGQLRGGKRSLGARRTDRGNGVEYDPSNGNSPARPAGRPGVAPIPTLPNTTQLDPTLTHTLQRHMSGLNQSSPDGRSLYRLLKTGLSRFGAMNPGPGIHAESVSSEACIAHLHSQLFSYVADDKKDPVTRIRARLLQHHLSAWLPEKIVTPATPSLEHKPELMPRDNSAENTRPQAAKNGKVERISSARAAATPPGPRISSLLRTEQDAWQTIYGTIRDFHELKKSWAESVDELVDERERLTRKLNDTESALKAAHEEGSEIRNELEKLRKREKSQARTRTGGRTAAGRISKRAAPVLARQDTFIRALEREVARARRNHGSLSVALIVVRTPAESALTADDIARCYANEVFTSFRVYDLVAQYDNGMFAVLFPDTDRAGSRRALEKAQKRATETRLVESGRTIKIPGFHAALAIWSDGEDAQNLLERLQAALPADAATAPLAVLDVEATVAAPG
jgi:GGDEF domain-containing protein